MGFFKRLIEKVKGMFKNTALQKFNTTTTTSSLMDESITAWLSIYQGKCPWVEGDIKTIDMSKTVCEEVARLTTLGVGIKISGSQRAEYLQKQIDKMILPRLRHWTEYGTALGTCILKPNGSGIDVVTPDRFVVTEYDSNKQITGVIFSDSYTENKDIYTKLEYHRFEKSEYVITSKAYHSSNNETLGNEIPLSETKWAEIQPEVRMTKENNDRLNSMLFGVFRMPNGNNVDIDSPLGMSIFANSTHELEDLDVAYSRMTGEIYDSQSIELIDDRLVQKTGQKIGSGANVKLPRYVRNIFGSGPDEFYQQIDRPLKTQERKEGLNALLSLIGSKCGFSEGYFVFDSKTGKIQTATQVEADDRRTIQLIKDVRDQLQNALDDCIYAMNVFADLYDLSPVGSYTIDYDWGDITYNYDEDRQRKYQLMLQGIIPKWKYLTEYEGYGEDEAKELIAEAEKDTTKDDGLFGEEE